MPSATEATTRRGQVSRARRLGSRVLLLTILATQTTGCVGKAPRAQVARDPSIPTAVQAVASSAKAVEDPVGDARDWEGKLEPKRRSADLVAVRVRTVGDRLNVEFTVAGLVPRDSGRGTFADGKDRLGWVFDTWIPGTEKGIYQLRANLFGTKWSGLFVSFDPLGEAVFPGRITSRGDTRCSSRFRLRRCPV